MKALTILLVGGYGVVGSQVAKMLNRYQADLKLVIAGRNIEQAQQLASTLHHAEAIAFDVNQPQLAAHLKIDIILAMVNDPQDKLLTFAHRQSIAYADISRWTARMQVGLSKAIILQQQHPNNMIFASSWMASVVANLMQELTAQFNQINSIDISVLYALNDNAGPNSIDYMDRLALPFQVMDAGVQKEIYPYSDQRAAEFSDGTKHNVYRVDMPEQFSLALLLNAESVATRIGFDHKGSNRILAGLVKSGFWKLISGPIFKKMRHKLLYNPGAGSSHQIRVDIQAQNNMGQIQSQTLQIMDPLGQTHLTAIGAVAVVMSLVQHLQQHKAAVVTLGEAFVDINILKNLLTVEGVKCSVSTTEK